MFISVSFAWQKELVLEFQAALQTQLHLHAAISIPQLMHVAIYFLIFL